MINKFIPRGNLKTISELLSSVSEYLFEKFPIGQKSGIMSIALHADTFKQNFMTMYRNSSYV